MIEISVHLLLIHHHVLRVSLVYALMNVTWSMHVVLRVHILSHELLFNWHGCRVARIRRVESLIIAEPIQILIVLLKHFLIISSFLLCFKVAEQAKKDLQCH